MMFDLFFEYRLIPVAVEIHSQDKANGTAETAMDKEAAQAELHRQGS